MKTEAKPEPKYHDTDEEAAIARAEEIGGYVIISACPADWGTGRAQGEDPPRHRSGYWSDPDGFVRAWEVLHYTAKVNR